MMPGFLKSSHALLLSVCLLLCLFAACNNTETETEQSTSEHAAKQQTIQYTIHGRVLLDEDSANLLGTAVFCAGTSFIAYTDDQGAFSIHGIPQGSYQVAAKREYYQTKILADLTLNSEADLDTKNTLNLRTSTLFASSIHTQLTTTNNSGIRGKVLLTDDLQSGAIFVTLEGTDQNTRTDKNGFFQIENIQPGTYTIIARQPGYDELALNITVYENSWAEPEETLYLYRTNSSALRGLILGQVIFLSGDGGVIDSPPSAQIGIVENRKTTESNEDGHFSFANIEPGKYHLIASAPGFKLREQVQMEIGSIDSALPILILQKPTADAQFAATLTGRVILDGQTMWSGSNVILFGSSYSAVTNSEGLFRITNIEPGSYSVLIEHNGFLPEELQDIALEQDQTMELEDLVLYSDREAPRVLAVLPEDAANISIAQRNVFTLLFNQKMSLDSLRDSLSFDPPHPFKIKHITPSAETDPAVLDAIQIILTNNAQQSLAFDTRYRLLLQSSAEDTNQNPMLEDFQYKFRTRGLEVLTTTPENETEDLHIGTDFTYLRYFFNGVVDSDTLNWDNVRITPRPLTIGPLPVVRIAHKTGWTVLELPVRLQYDTRYRVRLNSRIRSSDRTRLSDTDEQEFRTIERPKHPGATGSRIPRVGQQQLLYP